MVDNKLEIQVSDTTLIVIPLMVSICIMTVVIFVLVKAFRIKRFGTWNILGTQDSFNLATLMFGAILLAEIPNVRGLSIRIANPVVISSGNNALINVNVPINFNNLSLVENYKYPEGICKSISGPRELYYECPEGRITAPWFITEGSGFKNCVEGFALTSDRLSITTRLNSSICRTLSKNANITAASKINLIPSASRVKRWSANWQDNCLCYLEWFTCINILCQSQIDQINSLSSAVRNLRNSLYQATVNTQSGFNDVYSALSRSIDAVNTQISMLNEDTKFSILMTYVNSIEKALIAEQNRLFFNDQFNQQQSFNLHILKLHLEQGNNQNLLTYQSEEVMSTLFNLTKSKGSFKAFVSLFNKISKTQTYVNRTHIQIITLTQMGSEFIDSITYYNPPYCVGRLNAQCQDESYTIYGNNKSQLTVGERQSADCLIGKFCLITPKIVKLSVTPFIIADALLMDQTALTTQTTSLKFVVFETDKFAVFHSLITFFCDSEYNGIFIIEKKQSEQKCFKDRLRTDHLYTVGWTDRTGNITVSLRGSTTATFTINDFGVTKIGSNTLNIALPTYNDSLTAALKKDLENEKQVINGKFEVLKQEIKSINTNFTPQGVSPSNDIAIAALVLVIFTITYLITRLLFIILIKKGIIKQHILEEYVFASNEFAIRKDEFIRNKYFETHNIRKRFRNDGLSVPKIIDQIFGSAVFIITEKVLEEKVHKKPDGEVFAANLK